MTSEHQRHIFISYSRINKDFATKFTKGLRAAGFSVWMDLLDIPTGSRWDDEVENALRECSIFLIILTPASIASENVKDEIGYAIDHGKRILPVLLQDCDVPLRLRRFQHVDFTTLSPQKGFESVKQLLKDLVDQVTVPLPAKPPVVEAQIHKAEARQLDPPTQHFSLQREILKKASDLMKQGKQLAEEKDWAQAAQTFREVLTLFPNHGETQSLLANAEAQLLHQRELAERKAKEKAEREAKAEAERLAKAKVEAERKAKIEADRLAAEKAEAERVAQAKVEAERREKIEVDRLAAEKAQAERKAKEKAEAERVAQAKVEGERRAKLEADRLAAEKAQAERVAQAKVEGERKAKIEADRLAAERAEAERKAKEKAEAERVAQAKVEAERRAKIEADRLAAEKAQAERKAQEKAEAERVAQAKVEGERKAKLEADRLAAEKAEAERVAQAKVEGERKAKMEADRLAAEKAEAERKAKEKAEREAKAEAERVAQAKVEAERRAKLEADRLAAEKAEAERKPQEKAEHEAERKAKIEADHLMAKDAEAELRAGAIPMPALPIESDVETVSAATAQKKPISKGLMIGMVAVGVLVIAGIGFSALSKTRSNTPPVDNPATEAQVVENSVTEAPIGIPTSSEPAIGSTMAGDAGMILVYVPGGEFTMGSDFGELNEAPVHEVNLDAFWIDQTEVTNKMYSLCVQAGVCKEPVDKSSTTNSSYYGNSEFDNYPVIYVDWNMAKAYCEWVDRRLPTEAEWEKAARGTDERTYPWGNGITGALANYGNKVGDTTAVANYEDGKSPYGALNMAGNVLEWVSDWYDETYYESLTASNPLGPAIGTSRVLRGGSWNKTDHSARSSFRSMEDPTNSVNSIGFRCALSP